MGSPEFAAPSLKALASHYSVVGVITQPDQPSGRGRTLTPPPVKQLALEMEITCYPTCAHEPPEAMQQLHTWQPDVIVVAAFGQILRQEVLELPASGCINVHASLLPRWRGAAPIHAAILFGDQLTGVSIMRMDAGIDTGPVYSQRSVDIKPDDTSASLSHKLSKSGAELLLDTLQISWLENLCRNPQDESLATYAPC